VELLTAKTPRPKGKDINVFSIFFASPGLCGLFLLVPCGKWARRIEYPTPDIPAMMNFQRRLPTGSDHHS